MIRMLLLTALGCLMLAAAVSAEPQVESDWQVQWMVVAGGGNTWQGPGAGLGGTIGQTAVGTISGVNSIIDQGFWQSYNTGICCDLRADIDHDGQGALITDLIFLVNYMFHGGEAPPCEGNADVDGDGEVVIIDDLVYLVSFMFQGGNAPVPCYSAGA